MLRADLVWPVARFTLLLLVAGLVLSLLQRRWGVLSRFAAEDGSALNLAIARIVVMAVLLWQTRLDVAVQFAQLDPALMLAPRGWGQLMPLVPIDPVVLRVTYPAFVVAAIMALIGWLGRAASAVATILAFYIQTIPQLYGRVHTTNHLIVFGVILALAPCCDTLSVDALRRAVREADDGVFRKTTNGPAYGFALKSMMVTVGLIYFFPGAWKVSMAYGQWFTATNLSRLVVRAIHDQTPSALQRWILPHTTVLLLGTAATIVFELGFVFAILVPRLRPIAALAGVAFHSAIAQLMHIRFGALQLCYVIFIDWQGWFGTLATRHGVGPVVVLFDAQCVLCRRTIGLLLAFDWLGLLRPIANSTADELADVHRFAVRGIDPTAVFVTIDSTGTSSVGYPAYVSIARRLVPLWPVLPLLNWRPVHRLGERVYARVAASRACSVTDRVVTFETLVARAPTTASLRSVSCAMIGALVLAGVGHVVGTWPFACYPTFDTSVGPSTSEFTVEATGVDGRTYDWTPGLDESMRSRFSPERWSAMLLPLVQEDRAFPEMRARALTALWVRERGLPRVVSVRYFVDQYAMAVAPERWTRVSRREMPAP
jgi:predicted DCC family thiol-disulfide oxidoreductase YuxK